MPTKEDIESRLTSHDRRRIFESSGVDLGRKNPNAEGWINGLRRPQALGTDDHPSFGVNLETGAVKDFGSPYSNDLWGFIRDVQRCTFPEALSWVAEQIGMPTTTPNPRLPRSKLGPVPTAQVVKWNEDLMAHKTSETLQMLHYLHEKRWLSLDTIEEHCLGARFYKGKWWLVIPYVLRDTCNRYKMIAFDPQSPGWLLTKGKKTVLTFGKTTLYLIKKPLADPFGVLLICEGELDALLARQQDINAITGTGGAGTFKPEWMPLVASHPAAKNGIIIAYDGDEQGRRGARKVATMLSEANLPVRICDLPDGKDVSDILRQDAGRLKISAMIEEAYGNDGADSTSSSTTAIGILVSEVKREQVSWLWPGRMALGKLTIIDGDPGTGKSTVYCDMAARITTGNPWPDGAPCNEPGGVVIVTTEDGIADTIRPRLEETGADLSRIVVVQMIGDRVPEIPRDLPALMSAIKRVNAKLLVIDPLMAHLPSDKNSHVDQHMRSVLAPVAAFAEEMGVAVLVIRHWTKTEGRKAIYRGGGTIGIMGATRIAFMLTKDPEDNDRRILASTKNNLAPLAKSLLLRLVPSHSDRNTALIQWEGESTYTADDLSGYEGAGSKSAGDEAEDFLVGILAPGPVAAVEVVTSSKAAGIAGATLRRAKKRLGVRSKKLSRDDGSPYWAWVLPTQPGLRPTPDRPSIQEGKGQGDQT